MSVASTGLDVALAGRRRAAEAELVAATGGGSLCRVNPDRLGAIKAAEGRLAAVAEAQRAMRTPDSTPLEAVRMLAAEWQRRAEASEAQGEAWSAYRRAGAAELAGLVESRPQGE